MRRLITGVNADGRSCMIENADFTTVAAAGHGISIARVYATTENPLPPRPAGVGERIDVQLAPGLLRWYVVDHEPHEMHEGSVTSTTMHHKDTLDLVFVQDGTAELVLQDGSYDIGPGDFVVMPGIDHAWNAGPNGCRLVVVTVGSPPRTTGA
jgi:mannose-6-phosphate isomerase-like protein (cupin superfamily)